MVEFVFLFGLVIVGVGLFGIALPARMTGMVARVRFTDGLRYIAAAVRLALGAVLYLVADETDFPVIMRILAAFTVFAGVVVLFLDRATLQRWLDGFAAWPPAALRGICAVALALGVFLVQATA